MGLYSLMANGRRQPAGGPPDQPANAGRSPRVSRFLAAAVQLGLILLVIHLFKFEPNHPFLAVMCLAAGGFVVHAWLPPSFRLNFFCMLSLGSAVLLFGWSMAGWILGLGGGLIALCYLPIPLKYRALLAAVAGGMLALWRIETPEPFWVVLGSMFMFRLLVYLYDLRHERGRPPPLFTLAYFFPLPNLCFAFFPVLDFKTFRRNYYNDEPYRIYQSGIGWIVRGLTHLLGYRIIKYYFLPAPHHMIDLPHLMLFLAANYALYLRVSGWFHLITGMLHLFGFNLPRTHHNYFLASSVSDVWRRINIYWKDFMAKIFFYPVFYALSDWGTRLALIVAGLGVFVATWLLHSYQVFWLRGELPLSWNDAVLWLTAGVLVTLQLQFDLSATVEKQQSSTQSPGSASFFSEALLKILSFPRSAWERTLGRSASRPAKGTDATRSVACGRSHAERGNERESSIQSPDSASFFHEAAASAILALRIMGTFLLVSLFWACWTLPQFPSYLYVLATSGRFTTLSGILTVFGFVILGVTAGVLLRLARGWLVRRVELLDSGSFPLSIAVPTATLLVLAAAGTPQVGDALAPEAAKVLATLRLEAPTPAEAAMALQGYYEQLADTHTQASPLRDMPGLPARNPPPPEYTNMTRPTDDFLERELIPGWSGEVVGHRLTINSLGMRDREGLTREKPAGVCRLAFLGSSVVMGYGVGDEEPFTRLLEKRLNADRVDDNRRRIEVLNFGTGKSAAIHRRTLLERKVLAFDPDAIYYVAHQDEFEGTVRHLALLIDRRDDLPAYLRDIVQQAGIDAHTPPDQVEPRLHLVASQIIRGIYADILQQCRQRGILPVWIYLPIPTGIQSAAFEPSELLGLAEEAGFIVLNLKKWIVNRDTRELLADRYHPNAVGHRLIADRLGTMLQQRRDALPGCAATK